MVNLHRRVSAGQDITPAVIATGFAALKKDILNATSDTTNIGR